MPPDERFLRRTERLLMLSIITPSLNQGSFIERTIQSVLTQDFTDFEYFIIDGGSKDETLTILKRYSHQLRFISEPDQGQANAVNKGLAMTTGEIIGWINSDDIYYPNTFKKIITYFNANPKIDVVYGKANHIDELDQIIDLYPTQEWDICELKKSCFLSQPAVFWRRRLLNQIGKLDETLNYCMDYEYWLRLALQNISFGYLDDILSGSRLHSSTKTLREPFNATLETMTMLKQKLGTVPVSWLIVFAVAQVKHNQPIRFKSIFFQISIFFSFLYNAFRWNGILNGVRSCFQVPSALRERGLPSDSEKWLQPER